MKTLSATLLALLLAAPTSWAAELTVTPSSTEITEDENVSLDFKTSIDSAMGQISPPKYAAPDFDEINLYSRATEISSVMINGSFTVRQRQSVVAVLHPKKAGKLVIRNITVSANGQTLRAPDITIDVKPAGTKLGNRGGTGYPAPSQLPGGSVHSPRNQISNSFFLKTEPNKLKVYKGEQIILTYSIYTRVQLVNIQVERYPNINGFLKEDIDIPLLRGRPDFSKSVVNGQEYNRGVLAQYAIYALKEGSLPIDVFTGKFSYQVNTNRGMMDSDDPFNFNFNSLLMRAFQTATDVRSSDRINIEVMPLPGAGQPADFSGLVGDFDISAAIDKTQLKMGEPLNIKVKVEGKGHAGSLEQLKTAWPQDFELYEDKSSTQFMKTGRTERIFDYMLIPKTKGRYEIPPIEISMFNPDTASYQTRKTQPINVEVLEGSLGNVYVAKTKMGAAPVAAEDIHYWMDAAAEEGGGGKALRLVARGVVAASMLFVVLSLFSLSGAADEAARQQRLRHGQELRERAKRLPKSTAAPVEVLGEAEGILTEVLNLQYGILIGSLTRAEVRRALIESHAKVDETTAKRIESFLELCENQRFAPGGGDRASAQKASEELLRLVERIYPA